MLIGSQRKLSNTDRNNLHIYYDRQELEISNKMTYLGLNIDESLSWNEQINDIT